MLSKKKNNKDVCQSVDTVVEWQQGWGFFIKLCIMCHYSYCKICNIHVNGPSFPLYTYCTICCFVLFFSFALLLLFFSLHFFHLAFYICSMFTSLFTQPCLFLCFLFACFPSFPCKQVMTVKGSSILRQTAFSSLSPPGLSAWWGHCGAS